MTKVTEEDLQVDLESDLTDLEKYGWDSRRHTIGYHISAVKLALFYKHRSEAQTELATGLERQLGEILQHCKVLKQQRDELEKIVQEQERLLETPTRST